MSTMYYIHWLSLPNLNSSGTKVMDLGAGGGFPGIPLAIFFPGYSFPFG